MAHQLSFDLKHSYDTRQRGITLEVILGVGDIQRRITAQVDTGAAFCIFQRELGEALNLDIEAGQLEWIGTATGKFKAYGHRVSINTLGVEFEADVFFAEEETFSRNVLGQRGWLDHIQLGILDYEGLLYLSEYSQ